MTQKRISVDVYHVSTVHPNTDNRLYNKYVRGLVADGYRVGYICRESSPLASNEFSYFPLANRKGILGRIVNSWRVLRICWSDSNAIFHFHDPELIFVGALLRMKGNPVVYDVHEDNLLAIKQKHYMPVWAKGIVASLVSMVEFCAARMFNVVIAEKVYRNRFPEATSVLNYPVSVSSPVKRAMDGDTIELLYTGGITFDRGLKNHLNLLKQDDTIRLTMVGSMRAEYIEYLNKNLNETELDRVTLVTDVDSVPFEVIERHYRDPKYHFGLAVFPETPHYVDKELTKFFEYAQHSLPVLCSNFPVWRELIVENGVGLAIDSNNPQFDSKLKNEIKGKYDGMVAKCDPFCERFSWDSELGKVKALYSQLVDGT